jgi:hypothetical protein
MNREKLILSILLIVLVAAAAYSYIRMPRQKTVAELKYVPGMKATPRVATAPQVADEVTLRLDLLDKQSSRFAGYKRNLFKPVFYEEQKALPTPPPPPPPRPQPVKPAAAPAPPPPPAVAEQTPLQRDMASFTFLGFLKKGEKKTIFLSSNKEIFLARKGDRLSGKYDVTNITDEALVITSLDGGEIVIPLVENKPLSAPGRQTPGAPR